MPDIVHSLEIASDPKKVYAAITEADQVAKWWTENNSSRPEVGSEIEFVFDAGRTVFKMRVDEAEHGKRVVWAALDSPVPGWPGTTVTWDLMPKEAGTVLMIGHRGWPSIEGPFPNINFSWALYLQSLKDYLETGTGSPQMWME